MRAYPFVLRGDVLSRKKAGSMVMDEVMYPPNNHQHFTSFISKCTGVNILPEGNEKRMKLHIFKPNDLLMRARCDLGLSQQELAQRLKVALKTVWRWENGLAKPYPRHRQLLCLFFHKTAEELGLHGRKRGFSEPASSEKPPAASWQAYVEDCQAHPLYQAEYQAFLKRSQHVNHQHQCSVSFVDWLLAAHPEQLKSAGDQDERGFHRPA